MTYRPTRALFLSRLWPFRAKPAPSNDLRAACLRLLGNVEWYRHASARAEDALRTVQRERNRLYELERNRRAKAGENEQPGPGPAAPTHNDILRRLGALAAIDAATIVLGVGDGLEDLLAAFAERGDGAPAR